MDLKSLDQLREADERTLAFTPAGLGSMPAEEAAHYRQDVVARFELASEVAGGTRQSFDRLRHVYAYGVLCYDLFTLVHDHALLVFEQALRDRFMDYCGNVLTFQTPAKDSKTVRVKDYDEVFKLVDKHRNWRLHLPAGDTMAFNGMLNGLHAWARQVGLLQGQHNLRLEATLSKLRNFVAHPTSYHLSGPIDAAQTLSDLHEIINQLWGRPTPGGRLYPGPMTRKIMVLAWSSTGTWQIATADQLQDAVNPADDEWQCLVVRAVESPRRQWDWGLDRFDARFETTHYPTELLWGPGQISEAADWFAGTQPEPDSIDYLDRLFVARLDGAQLSLPMSPAAAASLPPTERVARWFAVRADYPTDVLLHVRHLVGNPEQDRDGLCAQCPVEGIKIGDYEEVLAATGTTPASANFSYSDVRSPRAYPRIQELHISDAGAGPTAPQG